MYKDTCYSLSDGLDTLFLAFQKECVELYQLTSWCHTHMYIHNNEVWAMLRHKMSHYGWQLKVNETIVFVCLPHGKVPFVFVWPETNTSTYIPLAGNKRQGSAKHTQGCGICVLCSGTAFVIKCLERVPKSLYTILFLSGVSVNYSSMNYTTW